MERDDRRVPSLPGDMTKWWGNRLQIEIGHLDIDRKWMWSLGKEGMADTSHWLDPELFVWSSRARDENR